MKNIKYKNKLKYKDSITNSKLSNINNKCLRFIQKEINPIKYIMKEKNKQKITISFNNLIENIGLVNQQ